MNAGEAEDMHIMYVTCVPCDNVISRIKRNKTESEGVIKNILYQSFTTNDVTIKYFTQHYIIKNHIIINLFLAEDK